MQRYNPMNDVLFKFIFGKEERKHITIDFINSMLDRDKAHEIVDITFKNVEMTPLAAEIKLTRLDVFCVTSTGEKVDLVSHLVHIHENNCSRCGQMLGRGRRRSGATSTDDDDADGRRSGNYCGYERGGTL
ncbi:MAG: PD-(D/E)XK nuclease family transposase [Selenomonadaceae bacterium]|nr:PD-(D/E)XK nuclease family transposase [Selenomonadaceae bacterium]